MKLSRIVHFLLHPVELQRKLRERWRARQPAKPHTSPLDGLPAVELQLANNRESDRRTVLELFQRNPSPMVIAPQDKMALDREIEAGNEYYLIRDTRGITVGCLGWKVPKALLLHIIIDFDHRSGGLALAAVRELLLLKQKQNQATAYTQVYRSNWRALNLMHSLGFSELDHQESELYYTLRLNLDEFKP